MKNSNIETALNQLNSLLSTLKEDEFPTPETDYVVKEIKKVVKTLNGGTAVKKTAKTAAKK